MSAWLCVFFYWCWSKGWSIEKLLKCNFELCIRCTHLCRVCNTMNMAGYAPSQPNTVLLMETQFRCQIRKYSHIYGRNNRFPSDVFIFIRPYNFFLNVIVGNEFFTFSCSPVKWTLTLCIKMAGDLNHWQEAAPTHVRDGGFFGEENNFCMDEKFRSFSFSFRFFYL